MDNNKKAIVVLDDFFGDDKLTHDMSAREAWDCIKRLLKKQETVKPDSFMDGRVQRFACGKCGKHLLYAEWGRDNYCSKCGQAVKWDD